MNSSQNGPSIGTIFTYNFKNFIVYYFKLTFPTNFLFMDKDYPRLQLVNTIYKAVFFRQNSIGICPKNCQYFISYLIYIILLLFFMFFFDGFSFFLMTEIPFLVFGLVSAGAGDKRRVGEDWGLVRMRLLELLQEESAICRVCVDGKIEEK